MNNPDPTDWDQPGDDGVLDDADTLASDDMTRDRLDAGIDPPDRYSIGEGWGSTQTEARRGESLEQLLAEEEPEQSPPTPTTSIAEEQAGQLVGDGSGGASSGTATELPAALPDEERDTEQGAMHIQNTTHARLEPERWPAP